MEELHRDFIERIAREAARMALNFRKNNKLNIQGKKGNVKDIVTAADKAIESYLRQEILTAYPDHSILGEEEEDVKGNDCLWILDPIDGTVSYAHGQPIFAISIAYQEAGGGISDFSGNEEINPLEVQAGNRAIHKWLVQEL